MSSQVRIFQERFQAILHRAPGDLRQKILFLFVFLFGFHLVVWGGVFFFSHFYSFLLGLSILAYGLGLRHAVDADHIAAIDNTTRTLIQYKKRPVAVGLFFSLGHSTVVLLLSLFIALSTTFVDMRLPQFSHLGSLIGTSISSLFLVVIGMINLIVFIDLFRIWRHVSKGKAFTEAHIDKHLHQRGLIARLLRPLLKSITASWQMYFVGFLFGLGFDTASEVALLSMSAEGADKHIPLFVVLLLPLAFTAGMALIDTLDGVLMLGAYGWATIKPLRKLYYNLNITFTSVLIALFIGTVEGFQVLRSQTGLHGGLFSWVATIQLDRLGYFIILFFVCSWIFSWVFYRYKDYEQTRGTKRS